MPGSRMSEQAENILKGKAVHPGIVVLIGFGNIDGVTDDVLFRKYSKLGSKLKSRISKVVISEFHPMPRAGEARNWKMTQINVWLRI